MLQRSARNFQKGVVVDFHTAELPHRQEVVAADLLLLPPEVVAVADFVVPVLLYGVGLLEVVLVEETEPVLLHGVGLLEVVQQEE